MRTTVAQVDALENIRSASDVISRELEGIAFVPLTAYTNLSVARSQIFATVGLSNLNGGELMKTVVQDVFFHKRLGEQWRSIGLWVGPQRNE